jgi:hypothetical protein
MLNPILRVAAACSLAAAFCCVPNGAQAQSTNKTVAGQKPAAQKADPAKTEKHASPGPFHGKLAELDKNAKTITVGKRTFHITAETKITKAGKPAVLADGVVGEEVGGYLKPDSDGKLVASSLRFGPKPDAKAAEKKPTK